MAIWAIADLHLAWGAPDKNMDLFGPDWTDYMVAIEANWRAQVSPEDLVLIAGDISWAMRLEEALIDLEWIDRLPGTKVMIRGNHDYWWSSLSKIQKVLPSSIHLIQNTAFTWQDVSIGGARLWDTGEYSFSSHQKIDEEQEKIYRRELERLEMSLKAMQGDKRIVMTHYPPLAPDLKPSRASTLLEKYGVSICIFGHLHGLKRDEPLFGESRGVRYLLTSSDYLRFKPIRITF